MAENGFSFPAWLGWLRHLQRRGQSSEGGAGFHAALGDRSRDRRSWTEAAEHYRQALAIKPRWTSIRVQLGNMLKEAGYHTDAEQAYRRAISEEPDNADTHLQLGHALKLQSRHAEARQAYLAALRLDPDLQPARQDLRAMGVSQRAIDQHIATSSADHKLATRGASKKIAISDRLIDRMSPANVTGLITDIGPRHVSGRLQDVSRLSLPLAIVCRDGEQEIATHFFEAGSEEGGIGNVDESKLPCSLSFCLDLPSTSAGAILHVRIEPVGIELAGSPFILPNMSGASLVERIERLETLIEQSGPPVDAVEQLEKRLVPAITAIAADRLEAILGHQREVFERQLLVLEARLLGESGMETLVEHAPIQTLLLPRDVKFDALDLFPGMGWSRAESNSQGIPVRFLTSWSSLSVRIANDVGVYLEMIFPGPVRPEQLRRLILSADGNRIPFWIEMNPQGAADDIPRFQLGAILPPSSGQGDGIVSCSFESELTSGSSGIAVSSIHLTSIPTLEAEFVLPASSRWLAQGWEKTDEGAELRSASARIILPAPLHAIDTVIKVSLAGRTDHLTFALNDTPLVISRQTRGMIELSAPMSAWHARRPNIFAIASKDVPGLAEEAVAPVVGAIMLLTAKT